MAAASKRKPRLRPDEMARIKERGLEHQQRARPTTAARAGGWKPDLKRIEELASYGLTQEQIAAACDISIATLNFHKLDDAQLVAAIRRGQSRGIGTVANALFDNATKKSNVAAQIFYLKARALWRDTLVDLGMSASDIAQALREQDEAAAKLKDVPEYNHGRVGLAQHNAERAAASNAAGDDDEER